MTSIQTQECGAPASHETKRSLTRTRCRARLCMCGAHVRAVVALPFVYLQDGSGLATEATGQWLRLSHMACPLGWRFRVVRSADHGLNEGANFDDGHSPPANGNRPAVVPSTMCPSDEKWGLPVHKRIGRWSTWAKHFRTEYLRQLSLTASL